MALLFLEEDPWLLEHESCEKLYRDIMEQLTIRQKYSRTSDKYSQLSANVRLRLKQFNNEVGQLNQKLQDTAKSGNITPAESERRTRQVEMLQSKAIQMRKIFDDQVLTKMNEDRQELIGAGSSSAWGAGSSHVYTSDPIASVDNLRAGQKQMLKEQEKGLANLSDILSRQKNIAEIISTEVDFHNEILDDLGNQIERVDHRVRTETQHIQVVSEKDNTCVYWIVIILLFITIVVIAAL